MAKKVLILSASPRNGGNSDLLCDQFLLGAKEAGHEAEKIFLRDKKINYCIGCGACQSNGGKCVQKDDMAEGPTACARESLGKSTNARQTNAMGLPSSG